MEVCIFCRIAAGEVPSDVVLDEEHVVAFRDINPQAPTHILLIPRQHVRDVTELTEEHGPLLVHLLEAARRLAEQEGIAGSGYRIVTNVGREAGQSVFHLHLHLLGGRRLEWPPG